MGLLNNLAWHALFKVCSTKPVVTSGLLLLFTASCQQLDTHVRPDPHSHASPSYLATADVPFDRLMHQAMAAMNKNMAEAKMTGDANHDFIAMMIPHHQGAIDMARAVLAHSNDTALRNLAMQIVTEQQNEINIMKAWLENHH